MSWRRTVELDVSDEDLKKCSAGQQVSLTITGTIKSTRMGEKPTTSDYEDSCCGCGISRGYPSSISVEMDSQKVKIGDNTFEALAEDDD